MSIYMYTLRKSKPLKTSSLSLPVYRYELAFTNASFNRDGGLELDRHQSSRLTRAENAFDGYEKVLVTDGQDIYLQDYAVTEWVDTDPIKGVKVGTVSSNGKAMITGSSEIGFMQVTSEVLKEVQRRRHR